MRRLGRKTRFACTVLAFLLVSVVVTVSGPNSPSQDVVLSVAAQNSEASNKTVSNTVSVLSDSVSLGSSLRVEGIVSSPQGPWDSTTVTLHMGDNTLAQTQTNESGAYTFSVPVGRNYVPAVFSGSTSVYTVAESDDPAVPVVPSDVVHLPVNAIPAYGIVAGVACIVVLGLHGFTRAGTKGRLHIRTRLAATRQRLPSWTSGVGNVNVKGRLAATRQRFPSWTGGNAIHIYRTARKGPEGSAPTLQADGVLTAGRDDATTPSQRGQLEPGEPQVLGGYLSASKGKLLRFAEGVGFRTGILLLILIVMLASVFVLAYRAWGPGALALATAVIVVVVVGIALYVYVRRRSYGWVSVRGLLAVPIERLSKLIRRSAVVGDGTGAQAEPNSTEGLPVAGATLTEEQRTDASFESAPVSSQELLDIGDEIEPLTQAPNLFAEETDKSAVSTLYNTALISLAKMHGLKLALSMGHWEKFAVLQEAAPEVRTPLRTLTEAYERTAYAGRSLTEEQRNATIGACHSIHEYLENVSGSL